MKLMLLLVVSACSSEMENLVLDNPLNGNGMLLIEDTVTNPTEYTVNWDDINAWFQIYGEEKEVIVNRSHTIVSPVGQGSVTIHYSVKYKYCERLAGPSTKALVEVVDVTTSMTRSTTKYLIWNDGGSLLGPINIVLDINAPQYYVDCRIIGTLRGEGKFWNNNNNGEHIEYINYHDSFNINNY
jgi:hypothetical protein